MIAGDTIRPRELATEFYSALHYAYNSMRRAFKVRAEEGLTQDIMAKRLDVDKGLISKRLNGSGNLTLRTLSAMASAMNCRLAIAFVPYEHIGLPRLASDTPKKPETPTSARP